MSAEVGRGPVATVVITTHDRPELARRALASVLAQTRHDIEVLIVDDGSQPPFVPDVDDERVRMIRNERAGGVCCARNAGLAVARGTFLTFLDDDDMLALDMVEQSVRAAEESTLPPPVAVMSAVVVLDLDGADASTCTPPAMLRRGEDFFLERKGDAGRAANSLFAPTEVLRSIDGWDEALEAFQHDDLGLRLNAVASIQGIATPLYRMSTHRAPRVSARWSVIPADMERTLAKHPEAFARHPGAHAHFLGTLGYYHLKAGRWNDAVRWTARGVRRNPSDPRLWQFLAAALAGPHVLRGYRRLVPRDSAVSTLTLNRRRARKYLHRAINYPRAVVGAAADPVTRSTIRRWASPMVVCHERSVLLLCVYRAANAATAVALVDEARARGWTARLWALDDTAPALAAVTVGTGPGAKFPLLNELVRDVRLDDFAWVVVADDDFRFAHGGIDDLLAVAEVAGLDLVQPAHTELSYRENEIAVRRPATVARRTTFVEIGPVFAVRRPWVGSVVPFPADVTMGWGLELDWSDLERLGARLGIVDGIPIRHLRPVGKGYAKQDERARLEALLRARGLDSFSEVQRTVAAWRAGRPPPDWAPTPPPVPSLD